MKSLGIFLVDDLFFGFFIDAMFSWFTPSWRRRAHLIYKGGKRFLNYRRDLLKPEQAVQLEEAIDDLRLALRGWNKQTATTASGRLERLVDSTPGHTPRGALAENIEIFFVILVIFLGLRAYVAQPFRIPTGSMQPSLNGIRILPYDEEPSFFDIIGDKIAYGSSYIHETSESHKQVVDYKQSTRFLLFTRTTVVFDDNSVIDIPCARHEVMRYFQRTKQSHKPIFVPGETIIKARIDAGDMIVVNKMAYHFRKPHRGETFVFDTRGIDGIRKWSASDQSGGTHYVKRLCGLPGDSVSIEHPHLLVNGDIPDSWTINRVAACRPPYNPTGYTPAEGYPGSPPLYLAKGMTLRLAKNTRTPALNEYCALGDNTESSLDSRYWGPVRQYNIIGPASFTLWPFTSHWGVIP